MAFLEWQVPVEGYGAIVQIFQFLENASVMGLLGAILWR